MAGKLQTISDVSFLNHVFSENKKDGGMYDFSSELIGFYEEELCLPSSTQSLLRKHRDINRYKLLEGLRSLGYPKPCESFVMQGSYATTTMNKSDDDDYELDDSVVFDATELQHKDGTPFTSQETIAMVSEAMEEGLHRGCVKRLKQSVRVEYEEGHHINIFVYRKANRLSGDAYDEWASDDWVKSAPLDIMLWFHERVDAQSPDQTKGRQLRRLVCFFKRWAQCRKSWVKKIPSGFILMLLAVECYQPRQKRDDAALYGTMQEIATRLKDNFVVLHPITQRPITEGNSSQMRFLLEQLVKALKGMEPLWKKGCRHSDSLAV